MRKLTFIIAFVLSTIVNFANAAVIRVAAPADLYSYATAATDGDVIELTSTGGVYNWSTTVNVSTERSVTIRAAAGLAAKPVITWTGSSGSAYYFIRYNITTGTSMKTLSFDGVDINADAKLCTFLYLKGASTAANINVLINNCKIRNFSNVTAAPLIRYLSGTGITVAGNFTATNTEFNSIRGGILNVASLPTTPNNIIFANCLFQGLTTNSSGLIRVTAAGYNSLEVNHCTFNGFSVPELYFNSSVNMPIVKNTIFANSTSTMSNHFGDTSPISLGADCGVYILIPESLAYVYPNAEAAISSDPLLDANGYATATVYQTGSTDGRPIGYFNGVYYNTQLNVSPTTLSGFYYQPNAGPSAIKSINISGSSLTGNVTVTAPADYEISTFGGSLFTAQSLITLTPSSGTVDPTSIYIRLKSGLNNNTYNESITVSSAGASTKSVSLTGFVGVVNETKTVNEATAGTLVSLLNDGEKVVVKKLIVTGNINWSEIGTIKQNITALKVLDLSGANVSGNSIPGNQFNGNTSLVLDSLILPNSLTSIGVNGVRGCTGLKNIIANGISTIEACAFYDCSGLITFRMGNNIATIGSSAFFNCTSLKKVICLRTTPPSITSYEFGNAPLIGIYVPAGSLSAYKAAVNWSSFNIIEYKLKPTTQYISAIKLNSAKLTGSLDVIIDSPVTAHGFCWNTTGTPTIADSKVDNGAKTTEGSYSNEITGLTEATTYYVRAFATDATSGTVYGDEVSFTTATIPATSSVCGNYYTSQYWPLSKSPYTICGNVNLAAEANLTIEPGVVINFAGDYEILVMGSIIAEGTKNSLITTTNGRIMFRKTNLNKSSLIYFISNGTKIQLANESEYTQDSPTNSDTLKIFNSSFTNSQIVTKGYQTNAALKLIDSEFNGTTVTGSYPRSEPVYFENCKIYNSTAISEPYNYGMYFNNCAVKNSNLLTDGCGGHLDVINSSVLNSTFGAGNRGCSGEGSLLLVKSKIVNTSISGIATVNVADCIIKTDSTQTLNLNGTITKSQFIGNNNKLGCVGLDAVTGTITNSTIVNHRIGLQTGALTINNSNLINNSQYAIKNTGATAIDAKNNFWGVGNTTTATVKAKIWDYYKDMNLGIVSFTNFLTSPNIDSPITPPMNFRKSVGTSGVNYSWNANPETDIKGYKLYYGAFDGFTFAHSVDVGNVTSYNLPTSAITDTVLVTAYDLLADGKDDMLEGHESWYSDDVPFPIKAGVISGSTTVCQGQNSVTYSVPVITNATSYIWTLPTGTTGTSTTNSISVNYSKTAVSGNVTVFGRNEYGDGTASSLSVSVNPLPSDAGVITGSTTVCQGQSAVIYTVDPIANATSYVWTLPTGATGTSTTNSITVSFSKTAVAGNVTVKGSNGCGVGIASTLAISVNLIPANAGTITGTTSVCQGENGLVYTVPVITNATSYVWTLPTGASGTSSTNSITVNYSKTAVSGNITVKGNDNCGDGMASTLAITVKPLPIDAGIITGATTVCQGQSSVVYSVPAITNATNYNWTLPTGATGTSTTRTITVNYGTSAISGNITVKGNNACGDGVASSLAVTVNPLPAAAEAITGSTTVCQGENGVVYTVPTIANATSYIWTLPNGATGTSTTNSLTINFSKTAISGNITVKGSNDCGVGTASSLSITVNPLPADAGIISGVSGVCAGEKSVSYSVPTITNATSYIWTLPTGATGTSTTNSITVDYSKTAVSGSISVKGVNSCGDGLPSSMPVTVKPLVGDAGIISGATTVCQGENNVSYSVAAIPNATSYVWTLPSGATGTSSTNSISINYGRSAISGNITVKGSNSCGEGLLASLPITVNLLPTNTGVITGSASVCAGSKGVVYTVSNIDNATSYVWSLPNGASGTSVTNSIAVDFSTTAASGNVTVKGINSCGESSIKTFAVSVKPLLGTIGTITGNSSLCAGAAGIVYTIPAVDNATGYVWTIPSGATGTSTTNFITVGYSNTAVSGNVTVKAINDCGETTVKSLAITIKPLLGAIGTITGASSLCAGTTGIVYTIPAVENATGYVWTLPTGATGTSTTNSITVGYSNTAVSGNVTVKAINDCGETTVKSLAITVNPQPATPVITQINNTLKSSSPEGNQWFDSKGLIDGAINQEYIVKKNDEYYVIVTKNGCSSEPSNKITVYDTAIQQEYSIMDFKVFPNPVKNELRLEFDGNANYEVISMVGQVIFKGNLTRNALLNTSKLLPGVYIVKLSTGNIFGYKKITKD